MADDDRLRSRAQLLAARPGSPEPAFTPLPAQLYLQRGRRDILLNVTRPDSTASSTVRTGNTPKLYLSATLGEEPEVVGDAGLAWQCVT